jgi:hypothetical protein
MLIKAIDETIATKLLYAAQVAFTSARRQPSPPNDAAA